MRTNLLLLLVLLLCGAVRVAAAENAPPEGAAAPTQEEIAQWVQQLGADQYFVRAAATRNLIGAGLAAVGPVAEVASGRGLEVTARAIYVLQELALSADEQSANKARQALEKIASVRVTAAARRARQAIVTLDEVRQQRTLDYFERLGAKIDEQHVEMGLPIREEIFALQIDDDWRGEETDLQRLKWLTDVQQITFVGRRANSNWIRHIAEMPNVAIVKIKHASINDDALVHLTKLERLQYVKLLYVPVTDGAVEHLRNCRQLSKLMLLGTKMTAEGAQQLRQGLVAEVDYGRGAFLGISASHPGENWFIRSVTPGSAAAKAGLESGDAIVKYEGQEVSDFDSLKQLISQNDAGHTATIEIRRGAATLTKQITLGEWD